MIEIEVSKFKTKPFDHQVEGIRKILDNESFALFFEMGTGKSKTVVDAACTLANEGLIDTVVVIVPASCRCVWIDPDIGEIRKHSWVNNIVFEYHSKLKKIATLAQVDSVTNGAYNFVGHIDWIVTNYEFLRSDDRLQGLMRLIKGSKALLVLDESSYIKNRTAKQTKAIAKLRKQCQRCVILNGTPIVQGPLDLWSQMDVLDPRILGGRYKNFFNFRAEYCEMIPQTFGGHRFQKVVRYKRLDQLAGILAPHVLRREKKDCLDLPDKLYTVREVPMTKESWQRYNELRRDCLITLGAGDKHIEPNAAVRLLRLAQLTSGHLGTSDTHASGNREVYLEHPDGYDRQGNTTIDFSSEKIDWIFNYLTEETTASSLIVWARWRRERERLYEMLAKKTEMQFNTFQLYGGQTQKDRDFAVKSFSSTANVSRQILLAQPHAGGHGLNLVAATEAIYMSNDFALGIRLQSEDRCHRPGQKHNVLYTDVLATGPNGQRTIDHTIFIALRSKKNIADMTTSQWRKELEQ